MAQYEHLAFNSPVRVTPGMNAVLGECRALIDVLTKAPLLPEDRAKLLQVSLRRGAVSTTAIEGNSITVEQLEQIMAGKKTMPPSKAYQENEVRNMLGAFNLVIHDVMAGRVGQPVTLDLVLTFHRAIIQNLGVAAEAIPGRLRENNVTVGAYRAPEYKDVPGLMDRYCRWLRALRLDRDEAPGIETAIIKAMAAHVYLEWIHPFGDGNGRTGRLIEYFILMQAGFPMIAGHILSNFYNDTRDQYYAALKESFGQGDLLPFFHYALEGLRDGLAECYGVVNESQISVFWQRFIYDTFSRLPNLRPETLKRRRQVMLGFPLDVGLSKGEIPLRAGVLAYGGKKDGTLARDLRELVGLGLLFVKDGQYHANWEKVCGKYLDPTKGEN